MVEERTAAPPVEDGDEAETIDALVALGVSEDAAREAVARGRVPLVLVQDLLGEDRDLSLAEVAEEAGLPEDVLRRVFLALGMSLQERFGRSDVEEARQIAQLLTVFPPEALVRLARVRGISVARIAAGDVGAVREQIIAPMRQAGADDLTVAVALAETAKALLPLSGDLLVHAHRRALVRVLSSELAGVAAREEGQEVHLAVGFVDLVGYTALSARVDPAGLDEVLDAFEERVFEASGSSSEVTTVKFLGDAAMFVAPDPAELAATLLEVVEPADDLADAPLRGGMSAGPVLTREGDYYGGPVNMAARLTDHARQWRVLADDALAEELEGRFELTRIRPTRLRGVGIRRPLAVRALGGSGAVA